MEGQQPSERSPPQTENYVRNVERPGSSRHSQAVVEDTKEQGEKEVVSMAPVQHSNDRIRVTIVYTSSDGKKSELIHVPATWKELQELCSDKLKHPTVTIRASPALGEGEIPSLDLIYNGDVLHIYPAKAKEKDEDLKQGDLVTAGETTWKITSSVSHKSGQAKTCKVEETGVQEPRKGFLKIYKDMGDYSRKRYKREIQALKKLEGQADCFPRLLATDEKKKMLVMTRIEGKVLSEIAKFELGQAYDNFLQLLAAVDICHTQGIFHRDIKPGNIMVDDKGKLYLIDLGLCYHKETAEDATAQGAIGPSFLCLPEFSQGIPKEAKRDARSDVTLCCGVLRWMLLLGKSRDLGGQLAVVHASLNAVEDLVSRLGNQNWQIYRLLATGLNPELEKRWTLEQLLDEVGLIKPVLTISASRLAPNKFDHDRMQKLLKNALKPLKGEGNYSLCSTAASGDIATVTIPFYSVTARLSRSYNVLSFLIANKSKRAERPVLLWGINKRELKKCMFEFASSFIERNCKQGGM